MPIIDRYFLREIVKPWLGISIILLGIFMSFIALKFLADAASGLLPGRIIFDLIGLRLIVSLEFLLPTTLFFSVMFAFGRLYADSEMTALFACGVGLNRVIKVVFSLSVIVAAVVAGLSLYVRPWAFDAFYRLRDQAMAEFDLSKLDGGNFYQIPLENRIFFADTVDHERNRALGVFVETKRGGLLQVISAKELYQRQDEGGRKPVLVFLDGHLYEFPQGDQGDDKEGQGGHIVGFQESTMSLEGTGIPQVKYIVKAAESARLARSAEPADIAEWQGRLAAPLASVLLALLAVPLSRSAPRQGKYARIVPGVAIYALYFNVSALAKSWVERGVVPVVPGIWWVPALLAGLVLVLLRQQVGDLFRRSQPPGEPA
ncbi:MAG TPA: LPS export ABC transporter permease LptF [Syntrophobacteria bacterium]|nr:LPS export ABC transporter permease LptF [Syntrophobacteria bacterium]